MNGKDLEYLNWRWKPNDCELPKFEPYSFLNIIRGKTLAFVGDSLSLNQLNSLLCLVSQVIYIYIYIYISLPSFLGTIIFSPIFAHIYI
ncbi:putative PC-Esterase [Dioscorea sansibarensis]